MAKEKKFDPVTVIGLILALAMFIAGNLYIAKRNQAAQQARQQWEAAEAERLKTEAAAQPAPPVVTTTPDKPILKNGEPPPQTGEKPPVPAAVGEDAEPADAGDITIVNPQLELVFTAKGATLRSAELPDQYRDPAVKVPRPTDPPGTKIMGLELLAELEKGKRSFGLQHFEIGPPEAEREKERLLLAGPNGLDNRVWKLESNSGSFDNAGDWKLVYSTTLQKKFKVQKIFTLNKASRHVTLDIVVGNHGTEPAVFSYALVGPAGILLDGPPKNPKGGAYVYIAGELAGRDAPAAGEPVPAPDVMHIDAAGVAKQDEIKHSISRQQNLWGALKNRFYMSMFISADPQQLIKIKAVPVASDPTAADKRLAEANMLIMGQRRQSAAVAPDHESAPDRYALYMGPSNEGPLQEAELALKPAQPLNLPTAIQYCDIFGWRWPRVDWIARQFVRLFQLLYTVFGNYGVAVILLTLTIKMALHPLQRKMMVSMNKFQKLQPEIKKLQEKYKNQTSTEAKQKLYLEQQDLMRKAGANPAAGCLPMFVQIPVFSALYGIFNRAFEIRGAEFIWIKDLSQQDSFALVSNFPINLLPIIYVGVTILQTRMTPQPVSDDPQQEMQRKMMMFMPVMISVMFYSMPSGLVLYFAASAIFGMLESWYIKKFLIKDGNTPLPPDLAVRTMA